VLALRVLIAEVPELTGCAALGPTYREALAAVEVVIAGTNRVRIDHLLLQKKPGRCITNCAMRPRPVIALNVL
jgi:hypothetical protein